MQSNDTKKLIETIKILLSKNGCPWDKKQNNFSMAGDTLEEVYEFVDALERKNIPDIMEELGDLFLHVFFHAALAERDGLFTLRNVIEGITDKLIRRHPHVFGDIVLKTPESVLKNWNRIKEQERKQKKHDKNKRTLPDTLPALMKVRKINYEKDIKKPLQEHIIDILNNIDKLKNQGKINADIKNQGGKLLFLTALYLIDIGFIPENLLNSYIKENLLDYV